MPEDSSSKTEKATPKKRKDQRKEGNIFQSTDVVNVVTLFGSFYLLKMLFPSIYEKVRDFMLQFLGFVGNINELPMGTVEELSYQLLMTVVKTVIPFMLVCAALGVLAHGVQTKFLFASKSLRPKLERISPIQGFKKLFSLKNVIELIKSILKVCILIAVIYSLIKADMVDVVRTMDMDITTSTIYMLQMIMALIFRITLAFVVIAMADFLFQWWDHERKLKMTKQEVKEEYKQTEGNPQIKGRIRDIQRQRARARMMQAVPDADVIIRNPTHFAVALKYDMERHRAPVVLAKGQDELALRIVSVAEQAGVAIIENKPLARGLYAQTQLNQEIPQEYYATVAEILVYVYKMKNKLE